MSHNPREMSVELDAKMGRYLLDVMENGEEKPLPTGQVVNIKPSAAMLKEIRAYIEMHGGAIKEDANQEAIRRSLEKTMASRAATLRLTGTDDAKEILTKRVQDSVDYPTGQ